MIHFLTVTCLVRVSYQKLSSLVLENIFLELLHQEVIQQQFKWSKLVKFTSDKLSMPLKITHRFIYLKCILHGSNILISNIFKIPTREIPIWGGSIPLQIFICDLQTTCLINTCIPTCSKKCAMGKSPAIIAMQLIGLYRLRLDSKTHSGL